MVVALTLEEMATQAVTPRIQPERPVRTPAPPGELTLAQMASGAASTGRPTTRTIGGYPISAAQSDDPIHYGTHKHPGVYDIGGNTAKSIGKSLDEIAKDLAAKGYVAAVRRKGQRNIYSDHIHFSDPKVNPT